MNLPSIDTQLLSIKIHDMMPEPDFKFIQWHLHAVSCLPAPGGGSAAGTLATRSVAAAGMPVTAEQAGAGAVSAGRRQAVLQVHTGTAHIWAQQPGYMLIVLPVRESQLRASGPGTMGSRL